MSSLSHAGPLKVISTPTLSSLPGPKKWKELALAAIEANNRCEVGGPKPTPRFTAALANVRSKDVEMLMSRVAPMVAKKRGSVATMAKKKKAA